jgi:hypothetical protein
MTRRCRAAVALFPLLFAPLVAQDAAGPSGRVPVPPLAKGGIAGLWYREHDFIRAKYGDFELLNFDNVAYRMRSEGMTDTTWQLTAMGNFLREGLQFATLARLKNRPDGVLLIMFEWVDPSDTTRSHGVFHDTFLNKPQLLVRAKQSGTGHLDTLEFSCADAQRRCGKLFYDTALDRMVLRPTDKD